MKRSLVAVVAAVGVLAPAGVAQGAVKTGSYKGKNDQGYAVSFKVVKRSGKKRLANVDFKVRLSCTDGDSIAPERKDAGPFKITSTGKYGYSATALSGASRWIFQGQIKGTRSRASGAIRWIVTFNEQNQPDPNGSITCDSGVVHYSAKRT